MKLFEICIAFAAAIALICAASANDNRAEKAHAASYFWHEIETHCVAVLTEEHTEKIPIISDGMPQNPIVNGEEILHIPEQTLKLRCSPIVAKEK